MLIQSRPVPAVLVVGYDAEDPFPPDPDLSPISDVGSGVTASQMARGSGIAYVADTVNPPLMRDFMSSSWTSHPTIPDVNDSFIFSFTSSAGYNLTELRMRGERNASGPKTFRLEVDLGPIDGIYAPVGSDFTLGDTSATDISFDLTSLDGVSTAAFRVLGFNSADSGSGSLFTMLDSGDYVGEADLAVWGVSVIPEPSSFLFGGLVCGVVGLAAAKRRLAGKKVESIVA